MNVTSIPNSSQDTVWDPSTSLMGQMSSCFVLHDVISEIQARLLYELGPNNYYINWLDILELNDLKPKFLFHYDPKCTRDLTCVDLSPNRMNGKFSGTVISCDNFKESLNSIGSIQLFYPLLNYLATNQEYIDLTVNIWFQKAANLNNEEFTQLKQQTKQSLNTALRKSSFDDSEFEQNVVSLVLNLIRYLIQNNEIIQDRLQRNDGISLLGFLLQRLPRRFIDINLLRICQEFVVEANKPSDKSLLNSIYEYLIFDFRIWNKAEYEIRIGHIQYISTIIKDDKKYFRKKYGIQFFLDILRTFFATGSHNSSNNESHSINDEDLRNLRNSFFGLIKYYAQKEIKFNELNAILSFLTGCRHLPHLQNDLFDVLISLLEAPSSSNDQLFLIMYEPNMADGLYALLIQVDLDKNVQRKLIKLIRLLLKTKKVYDKNKMRMRLDECGTYAGLINKAYSEFQFHSIANNFNFNEFLVLDLMENLLMDEANVLTNPDSFWHIMSLLNLTQAQFVNNSEKLIKLRLKVCEQLCSFMFTCSQNTLKTLIKSPAWQEVLCQYFCIEKNSLKTCLNEENSYNFVTNNNNQAAPPPIVISPSSTVSPSSLQNNDIDNLGDITEEENEKYTNGEQKTNTELLMSTPSLRKNLLKSKLKSTDQQAGAKKSSKLYEQVVTSTLMKNNNIDNKEFGIVEYDKDDNFLIMSEDQLSTKKSLDFQNASEINQSKDMNNSILFAMNDLMIDEAVNTNSKDNNEDVNQLSEKLLYIIYRLIWDGIQGSNEDTWKVWLGYLFFLGLNLIFSKCFSTGEMSNIFQCE